MRPLFDYCYYRISKAYKSFGDTDYCNWGYWVMFASFGFIASAITTLVLHAFQLKLNKAIVIMVFVPVGVLDIIYGILVDNRIKHKKFERLDEKYKNERFKILCNS